MIEVRQTDKQHLLLVDGVVVSDNERSPAFGDSIYFHLANEAVAKRIFEHPFEDLPKNIKCLWIYYSDDRVPLLNQIIIKQDDREPQHIEFELRFDFENWSEQWSIADYGAEVIRSGADMWNSGVTVEQKDELVSNGIAVKFPLPESGSIKRYIQSCLERVHELHRATEASLNEAAAAGSVVIRLNIPDAIRVPCEQYLLYFAEFLKDIGIHAIASINHDHNATLLSIIPANKNEALEKIRQALGAYLEIPSIADHQIPPAGDLVAQKLWSNIQHLRGQLALSAAIIEAKDATIRAERAKSTTMNLQAFLPAANNERSEGEDEEKALGGILIFKKADTKIGVAISLAEIVRKFRKVISL
ncbi:MAG: hypothetical protein NVV63_07255 [Opitutus sp.]|nr:hypothetical protein [Opitutus sp.]